MTECLFSLKKRKSTITKIANTIPSIIDTYQYDFINSETLYANESFYEKKNVI